MSLQSLAESLNNSLGPAFHVRHDYDFVYPSNGGVSIGRADAVIFSAAVPSFQTAAIGFLSLAGKDRLDEFAYLGAPLLVTENRGSLGLYKFSGGAKPEPINTFSSPEWVRDRVLKDIDSPQLKIPFATTRDLLIQDTRNALERGVSTLMRRAQEEKQLNEVESFQVAMAAIRQLLLSDYGSKPLGLPSRLLDYSRQIALGLRGKLSFANVPAESIAELYEKFAVADSSRRKHGVVYTPAWLARYVVDRLPAEAFLSGRALDPACGSGTFLVCFLERVIEHASRLGQQIGSESLPNRIRGIDRDPVAVEAARLSLDMFTSSLGLPASSWELVVADATEATIGSAEWLIGNLPFGYRTHEGRLDISGVILEHVHESDPKLRAMSLILPDSFAYSKSAQESRETLRSHYNIQEITRLPERAFESSSAATMVVVARKGGPSASVLVREVQPRDLPGFRTGLSLSDSFYSDLPVEFGDPWTLSPFSNEFEIASANGRTLGEIAQVQIGLQIYGMPESLLQAPSARPTRPLLSEPSVFGKWTKRSVKSLPSLQARRDQVRRPGPWEAFDLPKVIIRATTTPRSYDRLAAIPDSQGVWLTDKFVGIWPRDSEISIRALSAYLQTRFARAWFETKNPSRKARVQTLLALPIPKLATAWWSRAEELAPADQVIRPPQARTGELLTFTVEQDREWDWLNKSVEAAFGLDAASSYRFEAWLAHS